MLLSIYGLYELIYPMNWSHLFCGHAGAAGYSAARTSCHRFLWNPQHGIYASTAYWDPELCYGHNSMFLCAFVIHMISLIYMLVCFIWSLIPLALLIMVVYNLQKNHIFTSGASGTNAAVIRGALRAEKPELLTVILPQSLKKQPPESRELLSKVRIPDISILKWDFLMFLFWIGHFLVKLSSRPVTIGI